MNPYFRMAGLAVVSMFACMAVALVLAVRHRDGTARVVRASIKRMPARWHDRTASFADTALDNIAAFTGDRRRFCVAVAWGAGNWLLDAGALWVFLTAFGYRLGAGQLLLVYGLVGLLAVVPITPGGIGVVEAVLVPALVGLGVPLPVAILGVTAWRLVEFWMPMPLGGLAALSLLTGSTRPGSGSARDRVRG